MTSALRPTALRRWGLVIRAEVDGDANRLRALYAALREGELATLPWPPAAKAAFLADQFRLQRCHVLAHHPAADRLVVCPARDDAPVGWLYLDRTMRPWRIVDLALLPALQGRGIGATLLRGVQAAAGGTAAGATPGGGTPGGGAGIDLHVAHDNPGAARLYARLGFADAFGGSATHRRFVWTGPPASVRVS